MCRVAASSGVMRISATLGRSRERSFGRKTTPHGLESAAAVISRRSSRPAYFEPLAVFGSQTVENRSGTSGWERRLHHGSCKRALTSLRLTETVPYSLATRADLEETVGVVEALG